MTETATATAPAEPDISPVPDVCGHFVVGAVGVAEEGGAGEVPGVAYGGRFAPEALMAALDELTAAYEQARKDPAFRAELDGLLRGYAGRPTLLYRAERFGQQAGGCTVLLKREDLAHTGSHKINNVLGQVLLARRMGKTRVIAETGAGQHGVATATACALLGLDCAVYMGEEDTRRQALNVSRMRMLGAEVIPVATGTRTLKDAMNEAFRDWVKSVGYTHYCIGSNAIGAFHAFIPDAEVRLVGCEAGGDGLDTGRHAATLTGGSQGVLHGMRTFVLQDDEGQTLGTHSISAGLDYPGVGPEHVWLMETGRAEYRAVTDAEAMNAFSVLCRTEGIIPAIESAHALAGALDIGRELGPGGLLLVNLSGRGDKDVDTASKWFGV